MNINGLDSAPWHGPGKATVTPVASLKQTDIPSAAPESVAPPTASSDLSGVVLYSRPAVRTEVETQRIIDVMELYSRGVAEASASLRRSYEGAVRTLSPELAQEVLRNVIDHDEKTQTARIKAGTTIRDLGASGGADILMRDQVAAGSLVGSFASAPLERRVGRVPLLFASVIVTALADDGPDGDRARDRLRGERLAAPHLFDQEVTSAWLGERAKEQLKEAQAALSFLDNCSDSGYFTIRSSKGSSAVWNAFSRPPETAFRCTTRIAPDGFEPSTSRL